MSKSRVDIFRERMGKLWTAWSSSEEDSKFQDVAVFAVATGVYEADADIGYLKSFALVTWLFGAELQGSAVLASKAKIVIILAKDYFADLSSCASPAKDGLPEIIVKNSNEEGAKKIVDEMLGEVKKVGFLQKEVKGQAGPIADIVNGAIKKCGETINIAGALASILSPKDDDELSKLKKASVLTSSVIKAALIDRIERSIDNEKKISHLTLSDYTEEAILNPSKVKLSKLRADFCDPCYPPIIQSSDGKSNRTFDLRPSAESSEESLKPGCIVMSVGARYNFYCSNASRTLLMYPTELQEKVYNTVLKAQEKAIAALVPGAPLKSAYIAVKTHLKEACGKDSTLPDLASNLTKNVGFGMGIEFRDSSMILSTKNEAKVKKSMVFNVSVGVQNLQDKKNGTYAVLIADTVVVGDSEKGPEVYTHSARKDFRHISYVENDGDDDDEVKPRVEVRKRSNGSAVENGHELRGRGKRRAAVDLTQNQNHAEAMKQKKHQEELHEKMLEKARDRMKGRTPLEESGSSEKQKKPLDEFCAYKTPKNFPSLRPRVISVDMDNQAVIVPINGVPVPFHISVIKSVSKSDEGQHSYLRINFFSPLNPNSRRVGGSRAANNTPLFPKLQNEGTGRASYVKELSFRSSNPTNLGDCMRKIKELRKRLQQQETQAKEMESLVAQQSLTVERRHKTSILHDVQVRPGPIKRTQRGTLEAHSNGFRFRTRQTMLDIIYENIRHAFFQPAENQVIVIIHFHLKNEIMIGKKKTKDVQFYVQVVEAAVKLNDKRRRQFDQDELEEEQRERELRNRTNKSFTRFTREVTERYGIDFDIPYRELAFEGAPRSSAVTLLPTVSCIVDLIDTPPFILSLEDVEIAHFERVSFQLRMFDVVFIFKGFEDDLTGKNKTVKDMWTRISSIKMDELVPLKNYLDRQNIKFYEGPANLQWNEVLKNIRSNLEDFYEQGGWSFLSMEGGDDSDAEDDGEDEDDGDQEFRLDPTADEEDDDESSEDYTDSDASGALDELGGDSDAGEDDLSSDEEGMSWKELEKEAERSDRKKGRDGESDDDGGKKRKRSGNSRSGSSKRRR